MSDDILLKEAAAGHTKACLEEIKKGAKINFADTYGRTALFHATFGNYIDLVKTLLSNGADPNSAADEGTPLHVACKKGFIDIINLLIASKADVNAKGDLMKTPLHKAVGESRMDVAQILVGKGANINAKTSTGVESIHLACAENATDLALWLLSKGANVNARNNNLKTPLHIAAEKNNLLLVKKLLMAGADTTFIDIWGRKAALCGNRYIENLIENHKQGMTYDDPKDDDSDEDEQ